MIVGYRVFVLLSRTMEDRNMRDVSLYAAPEFGAAFEEYKRLCADSNGHEVYLQRVEACREFGWDEDGFGKRFKLTYSDVSKQEHAFVEE
jgi:hypothetical protein